MALAAGGRERTGGSRSACPKWGTGSERRQKKPRAPETTPPRMGHRPLPSRERVAPAPGKARRSKAKAEQRLLAAMQEHSGASVNVLAKAAGANRSSTGERLRGLASRGVVTKDAGGHWRLTADLAGEKPGPPRRRRRSS